MCSQRVTTRLGDFVTAKGYSALLHIEEQLSSNFFIIPECIIPGTSA